jgi:hypothetical protein
MQHMTPVVTDTVDALGLLANHPLCCARIRELL